MKKKLKHALKAIADECNSHDECYECPFALPATALSGDVFAVCMFDCLSPGNYEID